MFTIRSVIARLSLLCLLAGGLLGCNEVKSIVESGPKPGVRVVGAHLDGLSLEGATLLFDVEIKNPYDLPLPLVGVDYNVSTQGASLVNGNAKQQDSIPAQGSKTITVPARIVFAQVLSAVKGLTPGKLVPYAADMKLGVNVPGIGPLSLPLHHEGQLPVPAVPDVELSEVQLGSLSLQEVDATFRLKLQNHNEFALAVSKLDYTLSLGGTKVASSSLTQAANLGAGSSGLIEIPVKLSPAKMGLAAYNMLKGKSAKYELKGAIAGDTPFGPLNMPFERKGETDFKK